MAQRVHPMNHMTAFGKRPSTRGVAKRSRVKIAVIASLLTLAAGSSAYAAMAVIDASNLAQTAKTAATVIKQLEQLKSIFSTVTKAQQAIGKPSTALNIPIPGNIGNIVNDLKSGIADLTDWKLPDGAGNADFSNVKAAQQFYDQNLTSKVILEDNHSKITPAQINQIQSTRASAYTETVTRALAIASTTLENAPKSAEQRNALLQQPAVDLREQTAVLQQQMAALDADIVALRSVIAAQLQLSAMQQAVSLPLGLGLADASKPDNANAN